MNSALMVRIRPLLKENPLPDQEPFYSIGREGLAALADDTGVSLKQAMLDCLANGIWPERFRANRGSLSADEQAALLKSRISVVGCGGLGGMVILQLARLGIGGLTVCDKDVFEESNLNRQFLSRPDRLGRSKAQAAADDARVLNPAASVTVKNTWADPDTLPDILHRSDLAVDCLDNMTTRYQLEEACADAKIPYVHGALAGWEGFVMVVRPGDEGLKGLYGPVPPPKERAAEVMAGTPTPTPALVAIYQVDQAVKLLLGRKALEAGEMLHLDLSTPSLEMLTMA
jgi:molybdopterin/thiamine biosynthesis adenylyltransferase